MNQEESEKILEELILEELILEELILEELALGRFLIAILIKIIVSLISLSLYFTPTIIGIVRKKKDIIAIAVLNTFLGWTFIGWIISLAWALKTDTQNQVIIQTVIPSNKQKNDSQSLSNSSKK